MMKIRAESEYIITSPDGRFRYYNREKLQKKESTFIPMNLDVFCNTAKEDFGDNEPNVQLNFTLPEDPDRIGLLACFTPADKDAWEELYMTLKMIVSYMEFNNKGAK